MQKLKDNIKIMEDNMVLINVKKKKKKLKINEKIK
jgi:hypothetical protein